MGNRGVSVPPSAPQNTANMLVNRLAEANPELGAEILAQRRRFQDIMEIKAGASLQKKSIKAVPIKYKKYIIDTRK